jgi:putative heme-binding domain-containing protein
MWISRVFVVAFGAIITIACLAISPADAQQTLETQLLAEGSERLAAAAQEQGDAARGAVVFYQQHLSCTRCHLADKAEDRLGPDLSALDKAKVSDAQLVESVLEPSKRIDGKFSTVSVLTFGGVVHTGLLVEETKETVTLRAGTNFARVQIPQDDIEELKKSDLSLMPAGQVNTLASRQQFLDLIKYLAEIRDGGAARAAELEPAPSLYAARPLPEYESHIDHAGILKDLDAAAFKRGEEIYNRLCINCHGTHNKPGSLPTSLKFASGKFKNGSDPHTMYQTLTRGFGMMVPQTWMVPQQKYDVIHYVREAYLKKHNESQYFTIDENYLANLPQGDTRGPEPSKIVPWEQMDYGPNLVMTLEVGDDAKNFAYKGNAIRLDAGPGGVTKGRYWMLFDYDTMRVAAAWSGKGFINYQGINFDGRHNIHPRVVGDLHLQNLNGPGWGHPADGSFEDVRLHGRDDRRYGPLPHDWTAYKGMYYHGPNTIISYSVGETDILEMPGVIANASQPIFTRTLNLGPRKKELVLQVAHRDGQNQLRVDGSVAKFGSGIIAGNDAVQGESSNAENFAFKSAYVELNSQKGETPIVDMHGGDFTIVARIKTKDNGTLFAATESDAEWKPNGMTWFLRGGKLAFDIGWVGQFAGSIKVADGKWHDVAMSYQHESGRVQFFVDGEADGGGKLKAEAALENPVYRIGFTAANFPKPSQFVGEMESVEFHRATLNEKHLADLDSQKESLVGKWQPSEAKGALVNNLIADGLNGTWVKTKLVSAPKVANAKTGSSVVAGIAGETKGITWRQDGGELRLHIPPGDESLKLTLWFAQAANSDQQTEIVKASVIDEPQKDLSRLTKGGPARWPDVLTTEATLGADDGPFAVDVLTRPVENPWFCRMRLTGFDFTPDGKTMVVSAWDGSIWHVSGLDQMPDQTPDKEADRKVKLTWRRIGSGLFQPLGVKYHEGKFYVTCRDQICILHDLNNDGEIDFYENFNNDHQVTDHFHEFAMGLQTDDEGNFYYAKSARHALKALVPHHGTLLRVSEDGSKTEIVANGFRAANGVCLNPDGTFIVTDQEGHWNPKNRINYVKEGGFYGNMFGYHDVTDSADEAMEQPLCWITNSFDRSPAELLWVDSEKWGPLNGKLLNLSYGYGKVYVVPHEKIDGQAQGGMVELPIEQFPTGVMRGRFHPGDRQLYMAGMFAWAGSQQQPGGLYRLRATGKPVHLPVDLKATKKGLTLGFSGELDQKSAATAGNYRLKVWDLKRTASYGSKHYNEHAVEVKSVSIDPDNKTVHLEIPDIAPTWCMEIRYDIQSAEGKKVSGVLHNTIHTLGN